MKLNNIGRAQVDDLLGQPDYATALSESAKDDMIRALFQDTVTLQRMLLDVATGASQVSAYKVDPETGVEKLVRVPHKPAPKEIGGSAIIALVLVSSALVSVALGIWLKV